MLMPVLLGGCVSDAASGAPAVLDAEEETAERRYLIGLLLLAVFVDHGVAVFFGKALKHRLRIGAAPVGFGTQL